MLFAEAITWTAPIIAVLQHDTTFGLMHPVRYQVSGLPGVKLSPSNCEYLFQTPVLVFCMIPRSSPMKRSKSNAKNTVVLNYSLRHPCHDVLVDVTY